MEEDDFISKTRLKRRMTELQRLGAELVRLSPEVLARLDLPEALLEAVLECKRFSKHEAVRRQMQYIGRVMRDLDPEPIAGKLAALQAPSKRQTALFHVAEKWRQDIVDDPAALARFTREFPDADETRLRTLAESARAERAGNHSPKRYRELFHAVNDIVQRHGKAP